MAGYGKIVAGEKAKSLAKRGERAARGIMGDYTNVRAGITALSEGMNIIGQTGVNLYKGYAKGQSKWENIEAGAKEYGEDALADVQSVRQKGSVGNFLKSLIPFGETPQEASEGMSFRSAYESLFGPSEKTLSERIVRGDGYEMSYAEAGTLGKTITEGGRRFAKTYDPEAKEYKSIQDSGWGEKITTEGLEVNKTLDENAGGMSETPPTVESNVTSDTPKVETPKIKTPQELQSEDPSSGVPAGKEVKTNSKGQRFYIDDNGQAVIVSNINTGAKYGNFA